MKSVLISIRPEWCEKIISGLKTIEVRKTRPSIDTPFKCYIYQTKHRWVFTWLRTRFGNALADSLESAFGKVIGEFICDKMHAVKVCNNVDDSFPIYYEKAINMACMDRIALDKYSKGKNLIGWHISDLVIYDKPKELSEFYNPCHFGCGCNICEYKSWDYSYGGSCKELVCTVSNRKPIKHPPQSWCYVEEL